MKVKTILLTVLAAISLGATAVLLSPTPAEAANWRCSDKMYRQGSRGGCVQMIQKIYNYHVLTARMTGFKGHGYIATDGAFGPNTKRAVRSLQRFHKVGTDGIVGGNTWRKICQPLAFAGQTVRAADGGEWTIVRLRRDIHQMYLTAGCRKHFPPRTTYVSG